MTNRKSIAISALLCCGLAHACKGPGLRSQDAEPPSVAFKNLDRGSIITQLEGYESREYSRSINYKASSTIVPGAKADPINTSFEVSCSNARHLVKSINAKTGSASTYAHSEFGRFSIAHGKKEGGDDSKLSFFDSGQDRKKALDSEKRGFGKQLPIFLPLTGGRWSSFFEQQIGLKFSNYREHPSGVIELDFKSDLFFGSITLLSARDPVVIKSTRTRSALNMVTTTERVLLPAQPPDPMPRCQNYEEVMRNTVDGSELLRSRFEFSDYSVEIVPEKQFHLSNYGLPDPEGVPAYSKRSYRWVWLTSAAIVLFSISLLLRWMVRRRASVA